MKILITGADGQLGKACQKIFSNHNLLACNKTSCDITNPSSIQQATATFKPDIIVNCAAYTNVKNAQHQQASAYQINATALSYLCDYANQHNAKIIHISTDFVFDGNVTSPYTEEATPNPLNVYGRSKHAGEYILKDCANEYLLIRTSWVFGNGKNFVKTIQNLAKSKDKLPVVSDQYGSPTFTEDLAQAIKTLLENQQTGTFHITNHGLTTWANFAREIIRILQLKTEIENITSEQFANLFNDYTPRPKYSVLSTAKLQQFLTMRPWQNALQDYLQQTNL